MCLEMFGEENEKLTICQMLIANYSDCRPDGPNPSSNVISFDNIGLI